MSQRDPYLVQMLEEADQLLRHKDFAAALDVLNKADKDFPHQRAILARRESCLKKMGRETFRFDKEQKEKVQVSELTDSVRWDGDIVDRPKGPVRTISRRMESVRPRMVDPLQRMPEPLSPYVLKRDDSVPVIPLVLLIAYLGIALFVLLRGPSPGETRYFSDIPFVWVPPASKAEIEALEVPPESADALRQGFWMSQTEISVPDWERIVHNRTFETDGAALYPKTGVSYIQAEDLARKLSRSGEGAFRIPTAAEWQWASMAGRAFTPLLPLDAVVNSAWFVDNSDEHVQPVAQLEPNDWSLFDMLGNAEEWVDSPPPGESTARYRMLMGGAYDSYHSAIGYNAFSTGEIDTAVATAGVRLLREDRPSAGNVQRILRFPESPPIGLLEVNGQNAGSAMGDVIVLEDDRVTLSILSSHPADLSGLERLTSSDLYRLVIEHPDVEARSLSQLSHLTELVELDLSGTKLRGGGLAFLSRFSALEVLALNDCGIETVDLGLLHRLNSLRDLYLRENATIDSSAVEALKKLQQLETLDVTGSGLTTSDTIDLQLSIPLCNVIPQPTEFTLTERLHRASLGGEFQLLLHQIEPATPPEKPFVLEGYQTRTSLGARDDLSPGYWVYVAPYWYVWMYRDAPPKPGFLPWNAANVVDKPALEIAPDGTTHWSPATGPKEPPWLVLEFADYVEPSELEIYWVTRPYPIRSVTVYSDAGEAVRFASPNRPQFTEWTHHYVQHIDPPGTFLTQHDGLTTNRVRIKFEPIPDEGPNTPALGIDAIALVSRSGRSQWTHMAGASSSYRSPDEQSSELQTSGPGEPVAPVTIERPRFRGIPGLFESLFKSDSD